MGLVSLKDTQRALCLPTIAGHSKKTQSADHEECPHQELNQLAP